MRRAALAFTVLVLAGCGGDDEGESAAPPAADTPAAQQQQQPEAEPAGKTAAVEIVDFTFEPGDVEVAAGDEVTWSNTDAANHNVIFDGGKAEDIANLREGQEGSVTFDDAGTFKYVCSYHPGMEGSVVVQ